MSRRKSGQSLRTFKPSKTTVPTGEHEFSVIALSDEGRGIAERDGKKVFIAGALPGETVSARYISSKRRYDEALAVTVIKPSQQRVVPDCPHFGECGGCHLQHLEYASQVHHKDMALAELLTALAGHREPFNPAKPITAQPFKYRHRARLAVVASKHKTSIGFRRLSSHQVIDIDYCCVLDDKLNECLPGLKALVRKLKQRSAVEEICMSVDSQGCCGVLLLVSKILPESDLILIANYAQQSSVSVSVGGEMDWHSSRIPPSFNYSLEDFHLNIPYGLEDFTQVNMAVNQRLIHQAIEWLQLSGDDHVADFFCGLGNFSLPMALKAGSITGYEMVPAMVAKAEETAELNKVINAYFVVKDLMSQAINIRERFNKAILDPPRAGAQALCAHLANAKPERIVYISCNPQTLARDAEALVNAGYTLEDYLMADMFPQTRHSEAMAVFTYGDQG